MFQSTPHLPDQPGSLEASAFQLQLRRLESLQTLMTQGGAVVSEVALFLAKAREELSALQRDQENYGEMQQRLVEEKADLAAKVATITRTADEATSRAQQLESQLARLSAELQSSADRIPRAEWQAERTKFEEQRLADTTKISRLEAALKAERALRESTAVQAQPPGTEGYVKELATLKSRLSALEIQLDAERERRSRLMEVVKVHDVTVNGRKERETV